MTADTVEVPGLQRCSDCGECWADDTHLTRCADRRKVRDALLKAADELDRPALPRFVLDLWAHLTHNDDYATAARDALRVLELGWRPAIAT